MREAKDPSPKSLAELTEYIDSLVDRQHDYGTCCYAMSLAATAAFNYVAHTLGVTGFQASCADLDFLKRSRNLKGPFAVIDGEHMVYPQYDIAAKVREYMKEWEPWAAEQAAKHLEEEEASQAHPDVVAHWKKLAKTRVAQNGEGK